METKLHLQLSLSSKLDLRNSLTTSWNDHRGSSCRTLRPGCPKRQQQHSKQSPTKNSPKRHYLHFDACATRDRSNGIYQPDQSRRPARLGRWRKRCLRRKSLRRPTASPCATPNRVAAPCWGYSHRQRVSSSIESNFRRRPRCSEGTPTNERASLRKRGVVLGSAQTVFWVPKE